MLNIVFLVLLLFRSIDGPFVAHLFFPSNVAVLPIFAICVGYLVLPKPFADFVNSLLNRKSVL